MLKTLTVENVALIRRAEINFTDGLNVLSGETGAGKSVLLEAINFVLGARADKTMISMGETRCSVSCVFSFGLSSEAAAVLDEFGIEAEGEMIVKRVLFSDGRSTIRINGEQVTAQMLRQITSSLVDVHGQSDHFILLKEKNQLLLIDGLGGEAIVDKKAELSEIIDKIKEIDNKLKKLGGSDEERAKRLDFVKYCVEDIEKVAFYSGEDEELVARKKKLINAEKIAEAVNYSNESLINDGGVADVLGDCVRQMDSISAFGAEFNEISSRLTSILDEVNDISQQLSAAIDDEFDPKELDSIEARLDEISSLKRKYGATFEEIEKTLDSYKEEYNLLLDGAYEAANLAAERVKRLTELNAKYGELTELRRKVSVDLSKKLTAKLKELAMNGARFEVEFLKKDNVISVDGNDEVTFMFSANVGEETKPLSKIISSLMLGIFSARQLKHGNVDPAEI
ncbi:MAG: AAA family ATPase [Clostridia bacterium]|nr:AAA family ATPase [Clostridia bacterium]